MRSVNYVLKNENCLDRKLIVKHLWHFFNGQYNYENYLATSCLIYMRRIFKFICTMYKQYCIRGMFITDPGADFFPSRILQCGGFGMFIPDRIPELDFYPSRIPDLGSQISDSGSRIPDQKTSTKERGEKNFLSSLFMQPQISKNLSYFSFEVLKKKICANFQRILKLCTQKIVTKLSKIWLWDQGSGI